MRCGEPLLDPPLAISSRSVSSPGMSRPTEALVTPSNAVWIFAIVLSRSSSRPCCQILITAIPCDATWRGFFDRVRGSWQSYSSKRETAYAPTAGSRSRAKVTVNKDRNLCSGGHDVRLSRQLPDVLPKSNPLSESQHPRNNR